MTEEEWLACDEAYQRFSMTNRLRRFGSPGVLPLLLPVGCRHYQVVRMAKCLAPTAKVVAICRAKYLVTSAKRLRVDRDGLAGIIRLPRPRTTTARYERK